MYCIYIHSSSGRMLQNFRCVYCVAALKLLQGGPALSVVRQASPIPHVELQRHTRRPLPHAMHTLRLPCTPIATTSKTHGAAWSRSRRNCSISGPQPPQHIPQSPSGHASDKTCRNLRQISRSQLSRPYLRSASAVPPCYRCKRPALPVHAALPSTTHQCRVT